MQENLQLNNFSLISRLFGNLFYRQPTDPILSGVFAWLNQGNLSQVWALNEDNDSQKALDSLQMAIDLTLLDKEYQKLFGESGNVATKISAYDISVEEFRDFSVGVGVNEASAPREILLFDVGRRDAKLHTIRAHLSHVSSTFHFSAETLGNHDTHFVEVVTAINVESHTNAVLPQASIETEVKLVFLFIGQSVVTHL